MELLTTIFTRRSVRRFTPEPVSDSDLETLLRAGMQAPSADNVQPWRFIVINDRILLDRIPSIHPWSGMMKEAALGILVCGQSVEGETGGFWQQDCAAATENILLAAHGIGLGAVWLGICPDAKRMADFSALVGLPATVRPLGVVAVGHPARTSQPEDRYDPAKVHFNRW
ncbi:MAG: nitroreductase family protein [Anaerolineaceae bacterium]